MLARLAEETGVDPDGPLPGDLDAELARTRALGSETGPVFRVFRSRRGTDPAVLADDQPEDALLAALRRAQPYAQPYAQSYAQPYA